MEDRRDPYRVLGVSPQATMHEIRDAYRARARMAHPDLAGEKSISWMRDLNAAWDLLKDAERRAAYDATQGIVPVPAPVEPATVRPSGQPAWTGAAGRPPGRPFGPVLETGIYAGWSIGEIARYDRGYLAWLKDRPEAKKNRDAIIRMLDLGGGGEPEPKTKPGKGARPKR
jgi:curved DNA-binding protein CbpA